MMSAKHAALATGTHTSGSSGRPRRCARMKTTGPARIE